MYNVIARAYEFILDNHIHKLPVDLTKLSKVCKACRLHLISYSLAHDMICTLGWEKHMQYDGFTGTADGDVYILYRDALPMGQKMLTIAHEIGHNALGHMDYGVNQRNFKCSPLEQEADLFALCLLAPPCILQDFGATSIRDIQMLTYLDEENAKTAFDVMGGYLGTCYDNKVARCFRSQSKSKSWSGIYMCIIAASVVIAASLMLAVYAARTHYGYGVFTQPAETIAGAQLADDASASIDVLVSLRARMTDKRFVQTSAPQTEKASVITDAPDERPDERMKNPTAAIETVLSGQGETVYVTHAGDKYHKAGCRYIKNKDAAAWTISDAQNSGKTPCSVCYK